MVVQPSAARSTKWWHGFNSQHADRCSVQQSRVPPRPGGGSRLLARRSGNGESDFSGGMAAVVTTNPWS
ncbi:proline-rich receptor-like protein kinase PERK8 [Iris pallida]|uniref:Proline-rich receptor-like protein kinase PERK8 n=1 Tax=Iris pallida TaxID=29817 RepID=A0AAX6I390_IRIPA|nr:proline-rich receptor-like protein kinase PERK8 [Iris pallida]